MPLLNVGTDSWERQKLANQVQTPNLVRYPDTSPGLDHANQIREFRTAAAVRDRFADVDGNRWVLQERGYRREAAAQ